MKYSFVLIAYNEEHNIENCIESILTQEGLGNSFEILVIDDGSNDNTVSIVKNLSKKNRHIILHGDGRNHGRGYGRYKGVEASTGQFVIMVDADILLPNNWLRICLNHLDEGDVVGGIAVPDGDVAYIYRRFQLKPKIVMGSTTITGNNGLYKRTVLYKVNFNRYLREGEDVDFNYRLTKAGFSGYCIPGLTVEHQEHKSFLRSVFWLFQSGVGASRQLINYREIRLPDIAFAIFIVLLVFSVCIGIIYESLFPIVIPILFCLLTSSAHVHQKFLFLYKPNYAIRYAVSVIINAFMILSYYIGRFVGLLVQWRLNREI